MGNDLLRQYNLPYEAEMHYFQQNNILIQHMLEYEDELHYFQQEDLSREYMQPTDTPDDFAAETNVASAVRGWQTIADCPLPRGGLPFYRQKNDDVGCTQAVVRSINEYFGGQPIDDKDLNLNNGADFTALVNELRENNIIHFTSTRIHANAGNIGRELLRGHPVAITYPPNVEKPHTVGVNRIQLQQQRTRAGKIKVRAIIEVMDPLYANYRKLPESDFKSGIIRLAIPD